ncbi:MAG: DNA recombination/repair protein RecA, partial [Eubacterium sp.]|nr:DNA recombination/repair protein RecA [Eubacterium sp.]
MEAKQEALKIAVTNIEKNFGKGSIMKLGDSNKTEIESIPT